MLEERRMKLRRDGARLVFEDRPFVVPVALSAAALLMAYRLGQWIGTGGWTLGAAALALATVALAAGAMAMAGGSRFTFDRTTGRLDWSRRFFLARRRGSVRIADIETVSVAMSEGGRGGAWRGMLELKDGTGLPLTTGYRGSEAGWQDMVAGIRLYLGLTDRNETLTDRVAGMLRAGRKPAAIKLVHLETGLTLAAAKATVESITY
jgi:hypothetical protein